MSSEFDFENKKRSLQIAGLKPAALARIFRLDENSLVLTDKSNNCVHMPEGDGFEPDLRPGNEYFVDGIELSTNSNGEVSENRIVAKTMASDLSVIQGENRNELVLDVVKTCANLNESANMLYHGPHAAVLVQSLAILAVCAPDPPLSVETLRPDQIDRLGDQKSFQASLLHVSNRMCNAFREADKSMLKIKSCLIDLPEYFNATLEVAGQNDDSNTKKILDRTIAEIERAAAICRKQAESTEKIFEEVIEDIDALSCATVSSKTASEREKKQLEQEKEELSIKQEQLKIEVKRLEEEFEEAQKQAKQVLQEYREHMDKSADFGKLFLATLADGVMDFVKSATTIPTLEKTDSQDPQTTSSSNVMNYTMENAMIETLDEIATSLATPEEIDEDAIKDYIKSLESFEKFSPATPEGKQLYKKAKEAKKFLIKNQSSLKASKDLKKIQISIQEVVLAAVNARETRKNSAAAKNSLSEQIIRADTERVRSARDLFTSAEAKEEARRKERAESQRELTDIISRLKKIDTQTVDLTDIIKLLGMGIQYLGKVKKNWIELTKFFTNIKVIVDENLSQNVNRFIKEAKDPVSRQLMLRSALKATGYCIQVSHSADIYCAISSKYIMPIIAGIGEELALKPHEARAKQKSIDNNVSAMVSGVQQMIEDKQAEFRDSFHQQMQRHGQNMVKSVKIGTISSTKAIKS